MLKGVFQACRRGERGRGGEGKRRGGGKRGGGGGGGGVEGEEEKHQKKKEGEEAGSVGGSNFERASDSYPH